jgi:WD40 repeat protein/serine/threonine protein kinase
MKPVEIVDIARDKLGPDRESYVEAVCANDRALKGEVLLLLRRFEEAKRRSVCVQSYETLAEVKQGGMGVVYKARQGGTGRIVALKTILAWPFAFPADVERFIGAARAATRLRHPNIVQVYEVFEQDGRPFFSMEFVDGVSLADKLGKTALPPRQAAELVETLASAMHYAHEQGIVHRDLSPDNVVLAAGAPPCDASGGGAEGPRSGAGAGQGGAPAVGGILGIPKVTDFGLAKWLDCDERLTQNGVILGTPGYMAPEQAAGRAQEAGRPADVYALGAILYKSLTLRPPVLGKNLQDTLNRVISEEPVPPMRLQPEVPRPLNTICLKCLEKDPRQRYATAADLADDLRRFLNNKPIRARPVGKVERALRWVKRKPVVALLIAVSALAALALTGGAVCFAVRETVHAVHERQRAEEAEKLKAAAEESARVARQQEGIAKKEGEKAHQERERAEEKAEAEKRAKEAEAEARREVERLLANEEVDRSIRLYGQGESDHGALLMTKALEIANKVDASALEKAIRKSLSGGCRTLHPLMGILRHEGLITAIAFSPDGKSVLTGSKDGTARLWDAATGNPRGPILQHQAGVTAVAFSPSNGTILTASGDGTAALWDAATGKRRGLPLRHQDRVEAVAFSPDGKSVLTGSKDGTARLWDAATGNPRGPILQHQAGVTAVAFSPDGRTILTGSKDRTGRLWDTGTGKAKGKLLPHSGTVWAVAFSPDGQTVLTGGEDKTARLWKAGSGEPRCDPLQHYARVTAVAFSPDSNTALTGSDDDTAQLWEVATGKHWGPPLRHQHRVTAVAFSPDGKTVLTGSDDHTAQLWAVDTANKLGPPLRHQGRVTAVAFSPDGKTVLTGTRIQTADEGLKGEARLWAVGKPRRSILQFPDKGIPGKRGITAVAFSLDGKTILTGSEDATAQLWDAATGKPRGLPLRHQDRVEAVAFSPDGQTVLTGSRDGTAQLWDAVTGNRGQTLRHQGEVTAVAFSPEGKTVVTGGPDQTARLWEAATGRELRHFEGHQGGVTAVAFSPDGKTVVIGGPDQTVCLWEAATGKELHRFEGHRGGVTAVAFSPDGKTVLTGSKDGTARLWDAATGNPRGPILPHGKTVTSVAFSPDGKTVVTGCLDYTARLWDAEAGKALAPLFQHQGIEGGIYAWAVAFSPDGKTVLTGGPAQTAYLWEVPVPVQGDVERLTRWVQVLTGLELDEEGIPQVLDAGRWREFRRRLEELGGPPMP